MAPQSSALCKSQDRATSKTAKLVRVITSLSCVCVKRCCAHYVFADT
jgi:hypothetical protein